MDCIDRGITLAFLPRETTLAMHTYALIAAGANMPVTVYDTAKVPIECRAPECGDVSLYLIRELEANNEIPCPYCGQPIDLSSEQWRAALRETAAYYEAIILAEG